MAISVKQIVPVLAADDVERAASFYRDKLGFTTMRTPDDPGSCYLRGPNGNDLFIYKSTFPRGETTLATLVVDNVPSVVNELRDKGVSFQDYDFPGLKTEDGIATMGNLQSAWFKDTEGNTIAISNDMRDQLEQAA